MEMCKIHKLYKKHQKNLDMKGISHRAINNPAQHILHTKENGHRNSSPFPKEFMAINWIDASVTFKREKPQELLFLPTPARSIHSHAWVLKSFDSFQHVGFQRWHIVGICLHKFEHQFCVQLFRWKLHPQHVGFHRWHIVGICFHKSEHIVGICVQLFRWTVTPINFVSNFSGEHYTHQRRNSCVNNWKQFYKIRWNPNYI